MTGETQAPGSGGGAVAAIDMKVPVQLGSETPQATQITSGSEAKAQLRQQQTEARLQSLNQLGLSNEAIAGMTPRQLQEYTASRGMKLVGAKDILHLAREKQTVATSEKAEDQDSLQAAGKAQTAEAAAQALADSLRDSKHKPEAVREALVIIASQKEGAAVSLIRKQMEGIKRNLDAGEIDKGKENAELSKLKQKLKVAEDQAQKLSLEVDKTIITLRRAENSSQERALSYDLEIALRKKELNSANDTEKPAIEARIDKLELERQEIKDEKGEIIPGQMLSLVNDIYGPEVAVKYQSDPIGFLLGQVGQAMTTPDAMNQFISILKQSGIINTDKQEKEIRDLQVPLTDAEKVEKYGKMALKTTAFSGFFALLMMWMASKEKQQGAMG